MRRMRRRKKMPKIVSKMTDLITTHSYVIALKVIKFESEKLDNSGTSSLRRKTLFISVRSKIQSITALGAA